MCHHTTPRFTALTRRALTLLAVFALAGCQTLTTNPVPTIDASTSTEPTLYQQLGERAGLAEIVEDLLYLIVDDERISHQFKGINVAQFHRHLTDQLCQLSGGPCTYNGRSMRKAHADMAITETQFNALAENLILAMEQNGISTGAQNRLLKRLIPMHPDIRNL
ncbi:group I truncated hemoglobin [Marinobacter apostichopi]|uniref:group I truncated hemoglobin n=1 Tax=Marinobacter apostichopi TaxID=3035454 RepID=UPI00257327EC|nr:group 1 truncated hemoglobin [Marinobacter sp. LA51]